MEASPEKLHWSPGDIALLTGGEYSGTLVRIREINPAENKAIVSLHVFREHIPFEIELSSLRKPLSPTRHLLKAISLAVPTAAAGPLLFLVFLLATDILLNHPSPPFFSGDVIAATISLPFFIGVFAAVYVGICVLTDPDSQE